ncbi:MAG: hypothetical protein LBD03_03490 [Methanobrevibacter sp.]|jgi:hypothetical protein|nr:hypothetical protein [Candidatus Methanovirga procula]
MNKHQKLLMIKDFFVIIIVLTLLWNLYYAHMEDELVYIDWINWFIMVFLLKLSWGWIKDVSVS